MSAPPLWKKEFPHAAMLRSSGREENGLYRRGHGKVTEKMTEMAEGGENLRNSADA